MGCDFMEKKMDLVDAVIGEGPSSKLGLAQYKTLECDT